MTIFTFAATKGGEGKSTISVQAATGISLREDGGSVLAVDGDGKQISLLLSLSARAAAGLPGVPAMELSDGGAMRAQLPQHAVNYDHVVVDVGARDSAALRAALTYTDVVMVPFTPRSYALWAYENIIELVKEAQALRPEIMMVPFLNMADAQGADNRMAIEAISKYGYPVAPVQIGDRKAIDRASADGKNVSESRPVDQKAVHEIGQLVDLMLKLSKSLNK